jgi:hypothetical protein
LPAPVLRAHLDLNPSMMKHVLAYLQINNAQAERTIA